jgi:hypothetical protein
VVTKVICFVCSEPFSPDFGDNLYTRRLADDRRRDEAGNRLLAGMWASVVLLPTVPASVRQDQLEWLSWLDANERKYGPSPRSILLLYDTRRLVLNGIACLQPHHLGGVADLDEYLVLGFDGSLLRSRWVNKGMKKGRALAASDLPTPSSPSAADY